MKIQSNSMFNILHTIHIEMKQIRCIIVLTIVSFMGGGLVCTVLTTMKYTPVRTMAPNDRDVLAHCEDCINC